MTCASSPHRLTSIIWGCSIFMFFICTLSYLLYLFYPSQHFFWQHLSVPTAASCMCRCFATIQLYISPMTEHNCWLHSSRPCNARKPPSIPRLTQECSDPAAVCAAAQKGSNCSQHRKTSPRNNNHSGRSVSRKVHGELFKTSDDQIVREKTNATRDEQFRLFLSKFPHQITYI